MNTDKNIDCTMQWYLADFLGGRNNVLVMFKANGSFGSWAAGWLASGTFNNGYAQKHEFVGHILGSMADEYGGKRQICE